MEVLFRNIASSGDIVMNDEGDIFVFFLTRRSGGSSNRKTLTWEFYDVVAINARLIGERALPCSLASPPTEKLRPDVRVRTVALRGSLYVVLVASTRQTRPLHVHDVHTYPAGRGVSAESRMLMYVGV
jgi:hypothetical protein